MNVNMRVILTILIGVGLLIMAVILVVRAISSLTSSGDTPEVTQTALVQQVDKDSEMRLTTQGRINSDAEHRNIVISVTRNQVQMQVMQGYQNNVINTFTASNNEAAYGAFLRSLDLLGFANGDDNPDLADERGYCPAGQRFVLEANGEGLDTRYWSTSCNRSRSTSTADVDAVVRLFQGQVHDYRRLVRGVNL